MERTTEHDILRALSGRARNKGRPELAEATDCSVEQLLPTLERLKAEGAVKERGPAGYGDPKDWNTFLTLTVLGWQRLREAEHEAS